MKVENKRGVREWGEKTRRIDRIAIIDEPMGKYREASFEGDVD